MDGLSRRRRLIGVSHIDTQRRAREYDAKYPLDTPYGIRAVLDDYWRLVAAVEAGDYDAVDVLLDFFVTMDRAELTDKQFAAIVAVFVEGLTQEEAAPLLGLASKSGVNNLIQRAIARMAEANGWGGEDVYAEWARVWYGEERVKEWRAASE